MSEGQKIIKNIAIGFAVALAVIIVVGIGTIVVRISGSIGKNETGAQRMSEIKDIISDTLVIKTTDTNNQEEESTMFSNQDRMNHSTTYSNVTELTIYHSTGNLYIEEGDTNELKVDAINVTDKFEVTQKDGKVTVNDKEKTTKMINNSYVNKKITITVPKGMVFNEVELSAGVGNIDINLLETKELKIEAGVGNITGTNLIGNEVKIDCGVGNIELTGVNFGKTRVNGGVGNISVKGSINDNIRLEAGVGDITLRLNGDVNDYSIIGEKGLGSIKINGEKKSSLYSKESIYTVDVEGGLGNIVVDIK